MTPKVVLHFENILFLISSIAMFLVFIPSFWMVSIVRKVFKVKVAIQVRYSDIVIARG